MHKYERYIYRPAHTNTHTQGSQFRVRHQSVLLQKKKSHEWVFDFLNVYWVKITVPNSIQVSVKEITSEVMISLHAHFSLILQVIFCGWQQSSLMNITGEPLPLTLNSSVYCEKKKLKIKSSKQQNIWMLRTLMLLASPLSRWSYIEIIFSYWITIPHTFSIIFKSTFNFCQ